MSKQTTGKKCDFQSEADNERNDDENGCHGTPLLTTFPT